MPITIAVATAILTAGTIHAIIRPVTYESRATVTLRPDPGARERAEADDRPFVDTAAAYVDLLASDETRRLAGSPPVTFTIQPIPGTRSIEVTATDKERKIVRPALLSLLAAADRRQVQLDDPWRLEVVGRPAPPDSISPGTGVIFIATLLLTIFGALFALFAGRLAGVRAARLTLPPQARSPLSDIRVTRRVWRYPARP
jgi:hypothetical protein